VHTHIFAASSFAQFGSKRLIGDVFSIPGEATIQDDQLVALRMSEAHSYMAAMVACLTKLWQMPPGFLM